MAGRIGGRPRQIERTDIVRAGRAVGMRELSMNAVASALGVTPAALYRHVEGKWELERLVGESLLDDLQLRDDPDQGVVAHLRDFGLQLREHALARPGLASYLQVLFPRGTAGRRLLSDEVRALARRGYGADAAIMVSGAVASIAIGYAAAEDAQRDRNDEIGGQRERVAGDLAADAELGSAYRSLPEVDSTQYVRLVLTAAVRGLVGAAPPGRSVAAVIGDLASEGEDH
ncbi:TetR family transcriptional regulator [Glycomyces sp. NRRL B-16210]|uniref:TetR family transcriptional regulator n=1 Tax=Glycomyces sp. NRRL B-16210 TaxID=1463821 RepID=UPI0004BF8738|nr:TetR family transcriptional regulator [Glycomyces sp. NRRL B-16210]